MCFEGVKKEIKERAARTKALFLDVDGVLTDRKVLVSGDGSEILAFDIADGTGMKLLLRAGISVIWITGRWSGAILKRAADVGVDAVHLGVKDKVSVLLGELKRLNLNAGDAAYMGDDIIDLPVLQRVGLAAAPSDGHPLVRSRVHYIASLPGGKGAVRELCELILESKGSLPDVLTGYLGYDL